LRKLNPDRLSPPVTRNISGKDLSLRDRDTMRQIRIFIDKLERIIEERVRFELAATIRHQRLWRSGKSA
jgi:hypothetical protein